MKYYKIKAFSKLTSTTVRMLQYYDEINLLKPTKRSNAGYRLYSEADIIRLQQIITLKYLGLSLPNIKKIVTNPNFNLGQSLNIQQQILTDKVTQFNEAAKLTKYIASQVEAGEAINWKSTATIINILEINKMNNTVMEKYEHNAEYSELGKETQYDQSYNPERLYQIPRSGKRQEIGINPKKLPFFGFDCWNHYEVSWLNKKGKPIVATAEIYYDCSSDFIVESKSLKLYFNSFNNSKFDSIKDVIKTIKLDLEKIINSSVQVVINQLRNSIVKIHNQLDGECIDHLDIECDQYMVDSNYLTTNANQVEEMLYSDLLKSNCLVTNQPDWGSVQIIYKGNQIDREGLLKYIVSFRNHNEFHEQCIERIFVDIMEKCKPSELTVNGRYTRRGGLDINPYRSTKNDFKKSNFRLVRQ